MASTDADRPAQNHQNSMPASETSLHPNASAPAAGEGMPSTAVTPTQIREDLIATAVKFLQNPQVRARPLEQRRAFLKRKGMTEVEMELAMSRSGTPAADDVLPPATDRGPPPPFITGPHAVYPLPTPVPSSWSRLQDAANVIVLLTGAAYAVYHLYKRFIVPALYGGESVKSDPLLEVHRSVDELRRSLSDVVSSISETQTLMRSQQRQLDDVVRISSLHRGPDELERLHIGEVKDELKSLKALLLNRKQFPALPTTTPVIPAWQLHRNSSEKPVEEDNASSRVDTKSSTASLETSENRTDTNLSVTAVVETNQQSSDGVKDKLDHTQSEIVQNGISEHQDGMSGHRDGILEHRDGISEHHDGISEHHDGMSEHRVGILEHHDGMSEHHDGILEHHDGMSEHRDGISEHHDAADTDDVERVSNERHPDAATCDRNDDADCRAAAAD